VLENRDLKSSVQLLSAVLCSLHIVVALVVVLRQLLGPFAWRTIN
jgi:hypothetical protein